MSKRIDCARCLRPSEHCLCQSLVQLKGAIETFICQHASELKKRFKTAHLAELQLEACSCISEQELTQLLAGPKKLALLFPTENSREWQQAHASEFDALLVLDGTWSKAKRILLENPALEKLPSFHLPQSSRPSKLKPLRRAPEDFQLSTLEAVAWAHEIASGKSDYQQITHVLDEWVKKQSKYQGEI